MTSRVLSSYGVAIVSILLSYGTGSLAAEKSSTSVLLIDAHPHPDGVSCCGCERTEICISVFFSNQSDSEVGDGQQTRNPGPFPSENGQRSW